MDAPQTNPTLSSGHRSHTGAWVILAVFITLIIAGGGVYAWQAMVVQEKNEEIQKSLELDVTLNGRIESLVKENEELRNRIASLEADQTVRVDVSDWQTYKSPLFIWGIKYPGDWKYKEFDQSVAFAPQDQILEYGGEGQISLEIFQNPERLTMEEFFDGQHNNRPNYFTDALDGVQNVRVGGIASKRFKNVAGLMSYTVTIIPKESAPGVALFIVLNSVKGEDNDLIHYKMLESISF